MILTYLSIIIGTLKCDHIKQRILAIDYNKQLSLYIKSILSYHCQFHCSSAGSNKGDNFTCVIIAVKVNAKVLGKSYNGLEYMAKVMPVNEYRTMWLEEVNP